MNTQVCEKCGKEKKIKEFNMTIDGKPTLFCKHCIAMIRDARKNVAIDNPFNQSTCSS